MSGNDITIHRPGAVIRRTGEVSDNAGGSGGGGGQQGGGRESAEITELRRQISEITKLAHSGRSRDEARYEQLQPELRELTAQLVALREGRSRSVATTGGDAPASPASYPNLPADSGWRETWSDAKAQLQAAGISVEQSRLLGQIVLRAELEAQERAVAAIKQRRADCERALAKAYGSDWKSEVARGNKRAGELLPDGAAAALFNEQLVDGSILGDHEMIARLFIELARGRR